MNICLLNDSFPPVIDGVANVVMNYGSVMTQVLGANVVVGTPKYPDASYEGYPYRVVAYPSLDTSDFISGYRTGNPLSVREIAQLTEVKPDIIHTHCPAASAIMARILRKETGSPIVFTYHTKFDVDIARAVGEGFVKKETIRNMVNMIESCDDIWVVSEGAGENLRSLGFSGEYRVMPNGVDFPKGFSDDELVKEVTRGYDLPEGIPVYLFVGRLMNYKGLPLIVDALTILAGKGKDFRMVFVGDGADVQFLKDKVKENGIQDKVIFTGAERDRDRLRAWNTRADLFLFPSVYDTNGIVVREAAACGLGSVLIKGSCAAEGITDTRNGFLIDETPEAMAQVLFDTSDKLEELHQVGQKAMDEIYISWEQAVRLAYDRYKELHEMALLGELEIRKNQNLETFINSAATIINETQRVFVDRPRTIYEGMRENFSENIERLTDGIHDGIAEIRDLLNGNS